MRISSIPEFWLQGPVPGIPALLQPVAHALLQARQELRELTTGFPDERLWVKPGGLASVGFHLQHITGVLDRLFTYAGGRQLTGAQLQYLKQEGEPQPGLETVSDLLIVFDKKIGETLSILKTTDPAVLTETREVGRGRLPSTVLGLFFHAAEHTMRHTGQLRVTVKWVDAVSGK